MSYIIYRVAIEIRFANVKIYAFNHFLIHSVSELIVF